MQNIKWLYRKMKFDFHLLKLSLQFWFIRTYLNTLKFLGRSTADAKAIMSIPYAEDHI